MINEAIAALKSGKVVVYPTDTLYGLGADATNAEAVKKVFEIKKRDPSRPVSIVVCDILMAKKYCKIDEKIEEIFKKYLPGPYTFLVYKKENVFPDELTSGIEKVGVRIPDNKVCLELVKKFGKPITTTSANFTGEKSPVSLEDVPEEIRKKTVVVNGECKYKKESTIVDLIENKVVRIGGGKW